ncbi:hypothetical protein HK101_006942, partial [Irineochytrium annulatum]
EVIEDGTEQEAEVVNGRVGTRRRFKVNTLAFWVDEYVGTRESIQLANPEISDDRVSANVNAMGHIPTKIRLAVPPPTP